MPRKSTGGAKQQLPEYIKPDAVVLVKYQKSLWPSVIRRVYPAKVTYSYLPLNKNPQTFNTNTPLKTISEFDNQIPKNARLDLKEAYNAAFALLGRGSQQSAAKKQVAEKDEQEADRNASPAESGESTPSINMADVKRLDSAVVADAPKLKFVKDEVILTPKHDKSGNLIEWPAIIRSVKDNIVVFAFFPLKPKEVLLQDDRENVSPFPLKHIREMVEEAADVSPDLQEALEDAALYFEMWGSEVPPKKGAPSKRGKPAAAAAKAESGKKPPVVKKQAVQEEGEPAVTAKGNTGPKKGKGKPKREAKKRANQEEESQKVEKPVVAKKKAKREWSMIIEPIRFTFPKEVPPLDEEGQAALMSYFTSDATYKHLQDIWYREHFSIRHHRFCYPASSGCMTLFEFDHGGYAQNFEDLDLLVQKCNEWVERNLDQISEGMREYPITTPARKFAYVSRVGVPEMLISGLKLAHRVSIERAEEIYNMTSKAIPLPRGVSDDEEEEDEHENGIDKNGAHASTSKSSSGLMKLAHAANEHQGSSSDDY